MTRSNFPKSVKRLALLRSLKLCEAIGALYGLKADIRCNAPLSHGCEFDHILAASNGGDNSLENCAAVCIKCHMFKTTQNDTPRAAKTVRQQDKHNGITSTKAAIPSRPFQSRLKPDKGAGFSRSHAAHLEAMKLKGLK